MAKYQVTLKTITDRKFVMTYVHDEDDFLGGVNHAIQGLNIGGDPKCAMVALFNNTTHIAVPHSLIESIVVVKVEDNE